jgi:phosphoglycolate phosphatase
MRLVMSEFPFAMIGFDLDGTLVDSNPDLGQAINHVLRHIGREPVPTDATRQLIGGGAARMLQRALAITGGVVPAEEHDELFQILLDYYFEHIADYTLPFDGCVSALDHLRDMGSSLAVVTNKREDFAVKLVHELGMAHHFDCILGGDSLGPGRAKPAPDLLHEAQRLCGRQGRFAMVGDSSFDTRAARAAGVPVVAVSFGYNDVPHAELDCDALIDHVDELVPALRRL